MNNINKKAESQKGNLYTEYNDYEIMSPEVMEKIAKRYSKQIALIEDSCPINFDEIYLLLKENCRIFYSVLEYFQRKNKSQNYYIIQKILLKCENIQNLIKPYCTTIVNTKNKTITKSLPVCIINFVNIVNKILFNDCNKKIQNFVLLDKNSQNTTKKEQLLHINMKLVHICLDSIVDLQTIN